MRRVSWIPMESLPGVSTFVTDKSKDGLPTDADREKQQVLPPGSATPNSPRKAEQDEPGVDIRSLPNAKFLTPAGESDIAPRTLGVPGGEGEHPYKEDYNHVTRRIMDRMGYKRRIPWKRQKRQRTWKKLKDHRRYKQSVPRTKTRMKMWYKKVRRNRTFQDRRQKYRENGARYKRQKVARTPYRFIILPDFEVGELDSIHPDGDVDFTLDDGTEWSLPLTSFLYLAQPVSDEDESRLDSLLEAVPEEAFGEITPDDVEAMAAATDYDIKDVDLEDLEPEQIEALLEDLVSDAMSKVAYQGMKPGVRRHKQRGPRRRKSQMAYRRNRSRAKTRSRRWYQRNKRKAPHKRRRTLRKQSPNRYRMRYASLEIPFVVGPSMVEGFVVQVTPEATILFDVPDRGGLHEASIMGFLHSVVFLQDEDIEAVYHAIDTMHGEAGYPDITPDDVRECAVLNDIDPDSALFDSLSVRVMGVRGVDHAGQDDLVRLCDYMVQRSQVSYDMLDRVVQRGVVAGEIILYDQSPPKSDSELQDIPERPYKQKAPGQFTLQEKEVTHRPTPPDMPTPNVMQPGSGSGKVIPDSLKIIGSRVASRWVGADSRPRFAKRLDPNRTFWHGTYHMYDAPEKQNGVLWLALSPHVAFSYGDVYWRPKDSKVTVWEIKFKSSARIVDLRDLDDPIVRAFSVMLNESRQGSLFGPIPDDQWASRADFGVLEGVGWARGFFRNRKVDGILVTDSDSSQGISDHDSVALLNMGAVASMVPQGDVSKTAATLPELVSHTGVDVATRAGKVKIKLHRAVPERGFWAFKAFGTEGDYWVRLKAAPKGTTKDVHKLPVKVSCSCPFFRWQGPEHHAKSHGYLYGKPRGTASRPDIKDPTGKHWVCKHVLAAITMARQYKLAHHGGWEFNAPWEKVANNRLADAYTAALHTFQEQIRDADTLSKDWKGRPGNYLSGIGKGMYWGYLELMRAGRAWSDYIIDHLAVPTGKAKAVEMAARVFQRTQEPKDLLKWYEDNAARFELLSHAIQWPERSGTDGVRPIGSFKVHDTIGASAADWSKAEQVITMAERALPRAGVAGISGMARGDLYLVGQISRKNWAAWYMETKDAIYLRPNIRGVSVEDVAKHLIHELGHRYWRKQLSSTTKLSWEEHHRRMLYSGGEGWIPEVGEILPEQVAVNGKRARVESTDGFNFTLADVVTGKILGSVNRLTLHSWLSDYSHKMKFPSLYAATDAEEHFCESLALKALGKLQGSNLDAFNQIVG